MTFDRYRLTAAALPASFAAAGLFATGMPALAQTGYDVNWLALHEPSIDQFVSGQQILSLFGQPSHPGANSSVRFCYGIDQTQGGSNQDGFTEVSWIRLTQGVGAPLDSLEFGMVSVEAASVDNLSGDACFTSLFNLGPGSVSGSVIQGFDPNGQPVQLLSQTALTFLPGSIQIPGLGAGSVGSVYLQILGSNGALVPNQLGAEPNGAPLLSHLILEVQGPTTERDQRYWVLSTSETLGVDSNHPGGVTNGNSLQGSAVFGAGAAETGMLNHNRIAAVGNQGITFLTTTLGLGGGFGTDAVHGGLAITTPTLWASKDGGTGGGASDWTISSAPVSTIDLRVIDNLGGAEGATLAGGAPTSVDNPGLVSNFPLFLWSSSVNESMLQRPTSWDGTVAAGNLQPGSLSLGGQETLREGLQLVPILVDSLTLSFLRSTSLTVGTTFSPSGDLLIDGFLDALFGDGHGTDGPGMAGLSGGPIQLVAEPNPALAGATIGIAAAGFQADAAGGFRELTEVTTSLTITLQ